jgi:hypothetical protein
MARRCLSWQESAHVRTLSANLQSIREPDVSPDPDDQSPDMLRTEISPIWLEVENIAELLVATYGREASPLAERSAIHAYEQGDLLKFSAWCGVIDALNR